MEQLVRVQKLNADGTAQVLHIRQSACSGDDFCLTIKFLHTPTSF